MSWPPTSRTSCATNPVYRCAAPRPASVPRWVRLAARATKTSSSAASAAIACSSRSTASAARRAFPLARRMRGAAATPMFRWSNRSRSCAVRLPHYTAATGWPARSASPPATRSISSKRASGSADLSVPPIRAPTRNSPKPRRSQACSAIFRPCCPTPAAISTSWKTRAKWTAWVAGARYRTRRTGLPTHFSASWCGIPARTGCACRANISRPKSPPMSSPGRVRPSSSAPSPAGSSTI